MTKQRIVPIILTLFLAACTPVVGASSHPTQPAPATASPAAPTLTESPPTAAPLTKFAPIEDDSTQRTSPIDGMPQVYVPAGTLHMGGLDVHADDRDELPAHDVALDAFWVDQLEVTNAMYMLCVQAGGCTPPMDWASNKRPSYFNTVEFRDYPVVHVTWQQAKTYCNWADRRLPTEAEWERAARGDDFRNYPWGDEPPSGMYANFNHLIDETTRVGSYPGGASPFGALDMAGNVWEWVVDLYAVEYYKVSPTNNPLGPTQNSTNLRVIRGGSYQDDWINLRVSKRGAALGPPQNHRRSDSTGANEHSSKIGFRCIVEE